MNLRKTGATARRILPTTAALVGAALALTAWATSATPTSRAGEPGHLLAAFPTVVEPSGPNSGAGRLLASGLPTPAEPSGPNSGAG